MALTFLVRFYPTTPWRFGPDSGARGRVEALLHSDALFSAVTAAMARLNLLDDWLAATTDEAGPAVRFSSVFPFLRETLFIVPPRSVWPPAPSAKVRYKGARFVPFETVAALLNETALDEDRWWLDGESQCLLPTGAGIGPYRVSLRSAVAVDRLEPGHTEHHSTACLQFARGAGLWMQVVFRDDSAHERWEAPLKGALRWLADSGIGGGRSRGWGRALDPEWADTPIAFSGELAEGAQPAYWLLSVFSPSETDQIDWTQGNYATLIRSGRVESMSGWGQPKPAARMLAEGSVLVASKEPRGAIQNAAPDGFPHPVYRSGFAVSVPVGWRAAT